MQGAKKGEEEEEKYRECFGQNSDLKGAWMGGMEGRDKMG